MAMKKVAAVWSKKTDPNHFSIKLGQESDRPEYNYDVEVIVKDGNGKIVARQTNGFLTLKNPRTSPYLKEGQAEKIPATLQYDVLISDENAGKQA
jgi:hypothetical protein